MMSQAVLTMLTIITISWLLGMLAVWMMITPCVHHLHNLIIALRIIISVLSSAGGEVMMREERERERERERDAQ